MNYDHIIHIIHHVQTVAFFRRKKGKSYKQPNFLQHEISKKVMKSYSIHVMLLNGTDQLNIGKKIKFLCF